MRAVMVGTKPTRHGSRSEGVPEPMPHCDWPRWGAFTAPSLLTTDTVNAGLGLFAARDFAEGRKQCH